MTKGKGKYGGGKSDFKGYKSFSHSDFHDYGSPGKSRNGQPGYYGRGKDLSYHDHVYDYDYNASGKGKGFNEVKGSNGKIWVFCKNSQNGCPGKCFLGNNIPAQCNYCQSSNPWVIPKKHKHLVNNSPTMSREGRPASKGQSSSRSNTPNRINPQNLLQFCEKSSLSEEVTKGLFKELKLPVFRKPNVKESSLADLRAAEGSLAKVSNDLIGKYHRREKLQTDFANNLATVEAEICDLEAQVETANQLVSSLQISHTNTLGLSVVPSVVPQAQPYELAKELLTRAHSHLSQTEQSQFVKEDMFNFVTECVNSLASAVASCQSSGNEVQTEVQPPESSSISDPAVQSGESTFPDNADDDWAMGTSSKRDLSENLGSQSTDAENRVAKLPKMPVPTLDELMKSNEARQKQIVQENKDKDKDAAPS